ncbi:MAG: SIS domain-containing protein [Puniceicoccaceae bacterium]
MHREFERLKTRFPSLQPVAPQLLVLADTVLSTFQSGGKLLLAGNGGSASDCDHIAGELLKSFEKNRPFDPDLFQKLGPSLSGALEPGLPALPLPAFTGLLTAFSNDRSPQYAFAQLVLALGKPGDSLLCLTTSGNSTNILHATRTARALGLKTLALTGRDGGKITALTDCSVIVPGKSTADIQEKHLPIYHSLCRYWENSFFEA